MENHSKIYNWRRTLSSRRESWSKTRKGCPSKSSGSYDSQRRQSIPGHSSSWPKRRRTSRIFPWGESRKAKPPYFHWEGKAWLLRMEKYFQLHDYLGNEKARIAIYNINGRTSTWWERLRQVKGINERGINWERFKKYFKHKYLSTRYYDNKMKEFHELKLG